MRTLLLPLAASAVLQAQAGKLHVEAAVLAGHEIVIAPSACSDTSALVPGEHTYPGSITLSIAGGVAPYRVVWEEMPWNPLTTISALPGSHKVTVIDAAGDQVTRTVFVGVKHGLYTGHRAALEDPWPARPLFAVSGGGRLAGMRYRMYSGSHCGMRGQFRGGMGTSSHPSCAPWGGGGGRHHG